MTQEDKKLLLKDLSARLPYGVIVQPAGSATPHKVIGYDKGLIRVDIDVRYELENIKPYLRPMSSMTEKEKKELLQISDFDSDVDDICYDSICCIERTVIDIAAIVNFISWLNAHHFDYRGLIDKGLAIAVTKENNPYKE